ncbi:MAG: hypothetical protein INR69_06705 [Mucilaginibacter polytrichastri]|nr:hypothetical protein [Mucilaginibacter polytrichastri]
MIDRFFLRPILPILFLLALAAPANAQAFNKFIPGHFTDDKGFVYNGLICLRPSYYEKGSDYPHILYKPTENGSKQNIPLENVTSFVIARDSFVTARNAQNREFYWLRVLIDAPVKVFSMEIPGTRSAPVRPSIGIGGGGGFGVGMGGGVGINLGGGKGKNAYVYGRDESAVQVLDRKNYNEVMEKVLADRPDLLEQVRDKKFRFGDLEKLADTYRENP